MTIALAGNPNSGKTTLFNALTGQNLKVGNWPGVTVERREGFFRAEDETVRVVDLPGLYSLNVYSLEERVAREFVDGRECDAVLNIADACCLERSLYLTLQLAERGCRAVLALNMMDEAERRGIRVNAEALERKLGIPVVGISARKRRGLDRLKRTLFAARSVGNPFEAYDAATRTAVAALGGGRRAVAILSGETEPNEAERRAIGDYERKSGCDAFTELCAARYRRVEGILRELGLPVGLRPRSRSDRMDELLMRPRFALPLLIGGMALLFGVTFGAPGTLLRSGMERVIELAKTGADVLLRLGHSPEWAISLLEDGVIAGVGSVLTFLPQILLLFLGMSALEESGCLARAAFLSDRPLQALGLSGRSFIPLLTGFGCTAAAAMASRCVESRRDRVLTVLLTPFVACGAKLPVYAAFAAAFFPKAGTAVLLGLYALGIAAMGVCGGILRRILFRGEEPGFLMELPEYRLPSPDALFRSLRERTRDFLERAGTVIFAMSVLIWALRFFGDDLRPAAELADSLLGRLGAAIAPVFAPLGFGDAQRSVSLLAGLAAKEAVVSTLRVACGADFLAWFDLPSAAAFLVLVMLCPPCVSALAAMRRETGSGKTVALSFGMQLMAAYGCALAARGIVLALG